LALSDLRVGASEVVSVEPLEGFVLQLSFDGGTEREIDLERANSGGPVFEPLRANRDLFRQVRR
jgi:hypothetical protein